MTKNITVVDENSNILESTYPKRAKGLVKHNRARWIDDETICLFARPENKEEPKMANNIYEIFDNQISKMQEQLKDTDEEKAIPVRMMILNTLENLKAREQIDKAIDIVKEQLDFLKSTITDEMPEMNMQSAEQPTGVAHIIMSREATKQKIIALSEKLLDTVSTKPEPPEPPINLPMQPKPPMKSCEMGEKSSEAVNTVSEGKFTE